VQNVTLAPDGYERQMLVFNGSYPGPRLEANWGDMLLIHVTNELTNNGYGVLQKQVKAETLTLTLVLQFTGMALDNKGLINTTVFYQT
jgi:hypothetical protein